MGKVLAALDGLITGSNEMHNMIEINSEENKPKVTTPPQSKTPSKLASLPSESFTKQPITPRTVLHPPSNIGDYKISASNLPRYVRMQALVILIPINVKKLTIQKRMCQKEAQSNDGDGDGDNESVKKKQKSETKRIEKMENANEATPEDKDCVKSQTDCKSYSKVSEESETVPKSLALTPPLPGDAALPSSQPLPMTASKGQAAPPPQPPGIAALLPPQPVPMAPGKGPGAPPPPPPLRLGAKKQNGKLKRSTKLGELYRFLKAKIEGKDLKPRSRGVRGGSKGVGGKQGMADALAEITKK